MDKAVDITKKEIDKFNKLRLKKKIVLCHGAFDLFHPGHLDHLEESKKNGDILVVSITKDKHIKKSINSPFYKEDERAKFLSNISIVDYVCLTDNPTAIPVLKSLKPNFVVSFCKTGRQTGNWERTGTKSIFTAFCSR